MNLAERALAAADAQAEADKARKTAEEAERRQRAVEAIMREAARLSVDVPADQIVRDGLIYRATVELTEDAELRFSWPPSDVTRSEGQAETVVAPADQLYWNLPPGYATRAEYREATGITGGSYGCYGLSTTPVETLAQIGGALKRIQKARELWRKKHLVSSRTPRTKE